MVLFRSIGNQTRQKRHTTCHMPNRVQAHASRQTQIARRIVCAGQNQHVGQSFLLHLLLSSFDLLCNLGAATLQSNLFAASVRLAIARYFINISCVLRLFAILLHVNWIFPDLVYISSRPSASMPAAIYLAKCASYLVESSSDIVSMYSFTCCHGKSHWFAKDLTWFETVFKPRLVLLMISLLFLVNFVHLVLRLSKLLLQSCNLLFELL